MKFYRAFQVSLGIGLLAMFAHSVPDRGIFFSIFYFLVGMANICLGLWDSDRGGE